MTWPNFYLTCFLLGLSLSLVSFLLGALGMHGGHFFHGHGGHAAHGHANASSGAMSPFNFATLTAFLAWFGGAGYLLTRFGGFVGLSALLLSILTGLAGAAIM